MQMDADGHRCFNRETRETRERVLTQRREGADLRVSCCARRRAGRGWPVVWPPSPRICGWKTFCAGPHTVLDSKSPANMSELAKYASSDERAVLKDSTS